MADKLYVYKGQTDGDASITGIAIDWADSVDDLCAVAWGILDYTLVDGSSDAERCISVVDGGYIYKDEDGTFTCECPFQSDIKSWEIFIWKKNTGLSERDLEEEWKDEDAIPVQGIVSDIATIKSRLGEDEVNINRTLRVPEEGSDDFVIPPVEARANRILGFDKDGVPTVGDDCSAISDFTQAASAVKGLVSEAETAATQAKESASTASAAASATTDAAKDAVETITNTVDENIRGMETLVEQSAENASTAASAAKSAAESAEEAKRAATGDVDLSGYVDVKTDQTVNGVKSFTGLAAFAQDEDNATSYARWTIKPELDDGALRFTSEGTGENHFYLKPSSDMEDGDEATIALDKDVENAVSVAKTEIAADIATTKKELEEEIQKVADATPEIDTSNFVLKTGDPQTIQASTTFEVGSLCVDTLMQCRYAKSWDGKSEAPDGDIQLYEKDNGNCYISIGKYFVDGAVNALVIHARSSSFTDSAYRTVTIPLTKNGTVALLSDLPTGTTEGGDSSTYVTLSGAQTISGTKTFNAGRLQVIEGNTTYDVGERVAAIAAKGDDNTFTGRNYFQEGIDAYYDKYLAVTGRSSSNYAYRPYAYGYDEIIDFTESAFNDLTVFSTFSSDSTVEGATTSVANNIFSSGKYAKNIICASSAGVTPVSIGNIVSATNYYCLEGYAVPIQSSTATSETILFNDISVRGEAAQCYTKIQTSNLGSDSILKDVSAFTEITTLGPHNACTTIKTSGTSAHNEIIASGNDESYNLFQAPINYFDGDVVLKEKTSIKSETDVVNFVASDGTTVSLSLNVEGEVLVGGNNFVDLSSNQKITGEKEFSAPVLLSYIYGVGSRTTYDPFLAIGDEISMCVNHAYTVAGETIMSESAKIELGYNSLNITVSDGTPLGLAESTSGISISSSGTLTFRENGTSLSLGSLIERLERLENYILTN